MVSSAVKWARKKKLAHERLDRESFRPAHQMDPADITDPEIIQADDVVRFAPRGQSVEQMPATVQTTTGCEYADTVNMIKTLNGAIAAIARDTASIQRAYQQLRSENVARDKTLTDLSEIVREYDLSPTDRRPQRCCERTCWMEMATYGPLTSALPGRTTKPFFTASGWLDPIPQDDLA